MATRCVLRAVNAFAAGAPLRTPLRALTGPLYIAARICGRKEAGKEEDEEVYGGKRGK